MRELYRCVQNNLSVLHGSDDALALRIRRARPHTVAHTLSAERYVVLRYPMDTRVVPSADEPEIRFRL